MLIWARAINRTGAFALPFSTLWLTRQIGVTVQVAGLAVAVFGIASMVSRLLGGWLADRFGSRSGIVAGLLSCTVALAAMAAAANLPEAVGALALLGLGFEIYEAPTQAFLANAVDERRRPVAFGALGAALSAAAMLAGLIGAVLAPVSLRLLFVVDAATCLAAALVVLARLHDDGRPRLRSTRARSPILSPWRSPTLLVLFGCNVVFALCYLQVFLTLPLTLTARHIASSAVGVLLAVSAATVILGQLLLRRHRRARSAGRNESAIGFGLVGMGFLGYAFAPGLAGFVVATIVAGIGDVILMGTLPAVVSALAPPAARGRFLAAYGLSWGVAGTLGPPLGTWLLDHGGSRTLWISAAGCCGVVGCCQLLARWPQL